MIKFGKSLKDYEKKLIEYERKRTLLYLSMLGKKRVWIVILRDEKDQVLLSGIVKAIINGSVKNNKHSFLGGKFTFNSERYHKINEIFAFSFKEFTIGDDNYKKGFASMFNSSIYGDEASGQGDVLFSSSDLKPQDFNENSLAQIESELTGKFRKFNTRYYKILSESLS